MGEKAASANTGVIRIVQRRVGDVMGQPVALKETATVGDAVVTLFLENVGSLVVVDASGALSGIVSRKDLLKVTLGNPQAASVPLSMVMTRYPNIAYVTPDDTVQEAMRKMIVHEVDGLPVATVKNPDEPHRLEVAGRITKTTIIRLLYEEMANL